jgi:hypothetical protein
MATRRLTTKKTSAPKRVRAADVVLDHDAIAKRAYERYLARGASHGADVDDWLSAEAELSGRAAAPSPGRR